MTRASTIVLRIAVSLAVAPGLISCGVPAGTTGSAPDCLELAGQAFDTVAWAPDARSIVATGRRLDNGLMSLHLVSWPDRVLTTLVSDSNSLQGPGAIDDKGNLVWIESSPGKATIQSRAASDGRQTELGVLPSPRYFGLRWTAPGLLAIEWTGAGLPDQPPSEGWRIVGLDGEGGRISVDPLGPFEPDLTEFWASFDGQTLVKLLSPESGSDRADIDRADGSSTVELDARVADLALSPSGDGLVYRDFATAGFVQRLLTEPGSSSTAEGEYSLGAISTEGVLAAGTASGPGASNKLCFVETSLGQQ